MVAFRVGKPRCKVENVADVLMLPGFNIIPFTNTVFDDLGLWDGTGYVFERPGLWLFSAQVQRRPTATSSQINVRLHIDGLAADSRVGVASSQGFTESIVSLLEVQPGERLELQAQGHATLPWTLGFSQSFLSFTRIGPERWTG